MSEASPRGAEGAEEEYCLRLMHLRPQWKNLFPLGGFLSIGIVIYHCTEIDNKKEKAASEASPRGAEVERGEYRLRLMLSDWKMVTPLAAVADPLSSWGILGGITVVMYHYTNIGVTQEKAVSGASPREAEGEEGEYCLRLMLSDWEADPLSSGGILWGIGIFMYHRTDIDLT